MCVCVFLNIIWRNTSCWCCWCYRDRYWPNVLRALERCRRTLTTDHDGGLRLKQIFADRQTTGDRWPTAPATGDPSLPHPTVSWLRVWRPCISLTLQVRSLDSNQALYLSIYLSVCVYLFPFYNRNASQPRLDGRRLVLLSPFDRHPSQTSASNFIMSKETRFSFNSRWTPTVEMNEKIGGKRLVGAAFILAEEIHLRWWHERLITKLNRSLTPKTIINTGLRCGQSSW